MHGWRKVKSVTGSGQIEQSSASKPLILGFRFSSIYGNPSFVFEGPAVLGMSLFYLVDVFFVLVDLIRDGIGYIVDYQTVADAHAVLLLKHVTPDVITQIDAVAASDPFHEERFVGDGGRV